MKTILSAKRHQYLAAISILLIFSLAVVLTAGMVGCGGGEEEDEFQIQDWYDLNNVRNKLGAGYVWTLENDLDSHTRGYPELASPTANGGKGWEPIGAEGNPFKGTFDGGGNTISDLFIYRPDEDEVGLFGRVQEGLIENLGLVSVNVTGKKSVGTLVGYSWKGTLDSDDRPPDSQTFSHGSVTGEEDVGGLVGNNYGGMVNQCQSSADVLTCIVPGEERCRAGGLVGLNSGLVFNCDYNGAVNGDREVGGLVGMNERIPAQVGLVQGCSGAYSVNGTSVVGGLAGRNYGIIRWCPAFRGEAGGNSTVKCFVALNEGAAANAHFSDTALPGSYIGAVVGLNEEEGIVEYCSADATVKGHQYVGGAAGKNGGTMTGCNSSGYVTGNLDVGRFVGYNTGTVSNPESTSCVTGAIDCGPLVGRNEGRIRYNLTVSSTGGGSVTTPGEATFTYDEGEVINLVATPDAGYQFTEWTGDVYTIPNINAASTTITMQGNYEITASFEAILHSTYKLICDVPEVIVAGEETMIPLTVKTDELGELGYDGVQLHIKVYPRAGDVTIKVYPWVFTNEVYSEEFDLPADYNETIYPLVYFSEPGQYTFTFSVIEAPYGPVINNMTESITVSVVAA
jgi:hypothetical protein